MSPKISLTKFLAPIDINDLVNVRKKVMKSHEDTDYYAVIFFVIMLYLIFHPCRLTWYDIGMVYYCYYISWHDSSNSISFGLENWGKKNLSSMRSISVPENLFRTISSILFL